jgi:hypothetical protein
VDRDELRRVIVSEALPDVVFADESPVRADAVVLKRRESAWAVYLTTERAGVIGSTLREFSSEPDALAYALVKLRQSARAARSTEALRTRSAPGGSPEDQRG